MENVRAETPLQIRIRQTYSRTSTEIRATIRTGTMASLSVRDRLTRALPSNMVRQLADREHILANWKRTGEQIGEALRNNDPQSAIDASRNGIGLAGRDWLDIFEDLFPHHDISSCHDCSRVCIGNTMHEAYDGDYSICAHCKRANYRWSDRRDMLVRDDDTTDEDEEEEERQREENAVIGEYHSSKRKLGHIPSQYDTRKPRILLGIELEMEISGDYDKHDKARELLDGLGHHSIANGSTYQYAACEQDGSLDRGFEMVTGFTGLDVHAEQLAFFKNSFKGSRSHNTSTCGLHVHVCKAGMTLLHASKLVLFINDPANVELIRAIARRTESTYSQIKDKAIDKSWLKDAVKASRPSERYSSPDYTESDIEWHKQSRKDNALAGLNSSRYEAINFNNPRTVEFRLFKGTLKYETILSCLEFSFISWHFARDTSQKNLTTESFLKFICLENNRRDTRNLRAYLTAKGFTMPYKPKGRLPALLISDTTENNQESI